MYQPLLLLHSWTRWTVLVAAIYFLGRSVRGWRNRAPWTGRDNYFVWAFNQAFAYQVGFGLTLWLGLSPITKAGFKNPSLILESGVLSFWVLRHPLTMILALGAFHVGKARSRKVPPDRRFKVFAVTLTVVLALIASAIPWPGLSYGRALLRWIP